MLPRADVAIMVEMIKMMNKNAAISKAGRLFLFMNITPLPAPPREYEGEARVDAGNGAALCDAAAFACDTTRHATSDGKAAAE